MGLCLWVFVVLRIFVGFWDGSFINFSMCPAESPAQCRVRVRVKRLNLRRRDVAFSSLFNMALPTPSSAQSRGVTRVPCSRATWYRAMNGSVCHLLSFVCCICSTLFFRPNTSLPSGAVGVATFHPGYLSFPRLTPRLADGQVLLHGFSLVLAPVFLSISTRARLVIVSFLWLVCRRTFPAPPSRHTGGMRQVLEPFLPPPRHTGGTRQGFDG